MRLASSALHSQTVECSLLTNTFQCFSGADTGRTRTEMSVDPLPQDAKFDFLIVSECLYQASHEAPLLAVLQVRYGWGLG